MAKRTTKKPAEKATYRGGRPTAYKPEYAKDVYDYCSIFGATDKMLAQKFGIAEKTLNNWKADYPEFLQALNAGKDKFNTANVTKSLLQRALGYEIVEKEYKNGVLYRRTVKQVAPDVTACIFWLKNRDPERWRDKQELEHSGDLQINIVHYGNHNSAT